MAGQKKDLDMDAKIAAYQGSTENWASKGSAGQKMDTSSPTKGRYGTDQLMRGNKIITKKRGDYSDH